MVEELKCNRDSCTMSVQIRAILLDHITVVHAVEATSLRIFRSPVPRVSERSLTARAPHCTFEPAKCGRRSSSPLREYPVRDVVVAVLAQTVHVTTAVIRAQPGRGCGSPVNRSTVHFQQVLHRRKV